MKGVTWNGIFSDSGIVPIVLDLSIRSWSFQGSTLMRPPSGSAAMVLAAGFSFAAGFSLAAPASLSLAVGLSASGDGCVPNTADAAAHFVETLSPRCGLIRFGISFALLLRASKNN